MAKRKSRDLKLLEGTNRSDRDKGADPYRPKKFPKNPPRDLPAKGKFLWRLLVEEMSEAGVLRSIDRAGFQELCSCFGIMKELEDQIREEGWSIDDGRGSKKKNPLFTELKFYKQQFLQMGKQYGLFPASRQSIDFSELDRSEREDEMERLLSGPRN